MKAQPAGSASARAHVKSPESRIAFPPTGLPARPRNELNPLHRDSAQAQRDRSPPVRLFTQSGELLGGGQHSAPGLSRRSPNLEATCSANCPGVVPSARRQIGIPLSWHSFKIA